MPPSQSYTSTHNLFLLTKLLDLWAAKSEVFATHPSDKTLVGQFICALLPPNV